MQQLIFYTANQIVEKSWRLAASKHDVKIVAGLEQVENFAVDESIILIQKQNIEGETVVIEKLLKRGYTIILFADIPSTDDAINWFHKGIKGYLNSYANYKRIQQTIGVVEEGNIWLGQAVMQAIIADGFKPVLANNGWFKVITEREKHTLEHLLTGKANKEIANLMDISERTVKAHVSNLFKKFNVTDRLALVLHIQNWQEEE